MLNSRVRLLSILAAIVIVAAAIIVPVYFSSQPVTIRSKDEQTTQVTFSTAHRMILPGACTTVRWNVQNAREVFLDDVPVASSGQQEYCPSTTIWRTLRVIDAKGNAQRSAMTIRVFFTTNSIRLATLALVLLTALLLFFVALIGDLPLISKPLAPLSKLLIKRLQSVWPAGLDLIRQRDFPFLLTLILAAILLISSRYLEPVLALAGLIVGVVATLLWVRPHGRKMMQRPPRALYMLAICTVLLLFVIFGYFIPMQSQFWMGGDEIHVLNDGMDGPQSILNYDRLFNRPSLPVVAILATHLTSAIDGFLWIAAALRWLCSVLLFGIVRSLLRSNTLAFASAVLFIVCPSEPTRLLAVYMHAYNLAVFLTLFAIYTYIRSYQSESRLLLLLGCISLSGALLIVEAVYPVALFVPALLFFGQRGRRPHIGVWVSTWVATIFLLVARYFLFQRLSASVYQQSLASNQQNLEELLGNIFRQLTPTFSYLTIAASEFRGWAVGGVLLVCSIGGVALSGSTKPVFRRQMLLAACGAVIFILLAVVLFMPIGGLVGSFRTQFIAAPAQAILWAVGIGWLASWFSERRARVLFAGIVGVLVMISTAGAFHTQTSRMINPKVTYANTKEIAYRMLKLAPRLVPDTLVVYVFDGDSPLGFSYYVQDYSRYLWQRGGIQRDYEAPSGNGYHLDMHGFYLPGYTRYDYSQMVAFQIEMDGTVHLLPTLPESILPNGPTEADRYNPQSRILAGPLPSVPFIVSPTDKR